MQITPWSSNAITNQMLGSGGFPIRTTGAAWSRTQKAGAVAANPVVLQHLRVCFERPELGGNCGACEKCFRTKLNFCAVGIRPIPAIGEPVCVADVRRMVPLNVPVLYRYLEVLKRGTWPASDPIRSALAESVRQVEGGSSGLDRNPPRHGQHSLQRAKKRTRRLMRAIGSALTSLNPYRSRPII
jgi:hypothetical protein